MRGVFVVVHRWFGLFTAAFLCIAGVTGALISWDQELDAWLNPVLYQAQGGPKHLPALTLAERLERADPRVRVAYLPLATQPGRTLIMAVDPRINPATKKPFELDFDQVAVDPATGEIKGKRMWGAVSLSRENLLPFLYKLHYSLHIPNGFGLEFGKLFMGMVAIVWALDSLIALWISFPNWTSWRKSFAFRFNAGARKLNFDLHRSSGVWLWPLLLTLAVTAVSMNLNRELMRPLVSVFSPLTPNLFDTRKPVPPEQPIEPTIGREQAIESARKESARRGLHAPIGGIVYAPQFGVYGVGFFEPGRDFGDGSLGNAWLYFDGRDGAPAGADVPGTGSAGDIFLQAQFPVHSGRLFGLPGRVLVSILGLLVAMLSMTGVVMYAQKRRARVWRANKEPGVEQAFHEEPSI